MKAYLYKSTPKSVEQIYMSIKTVNPTTNEKLQSFDEMSKDEIEAAINQSEITYQSWRKTTYKQRAVLLHKVAEILRIRKEELAGLITLEMGKLIGESRAEIDLSADIFDYYADNGEKFLADKTLKPEFGEAFIRHSPIGVLLGVEPWNFPFYQVARFAAPNIMIGNTILLKHASNVPQCGIAMGEIFKEAGAPEGLYTNLLIPGDKISKLLSDDRIKGASLTGSEKAGASLAEAAGKNIKKSVLELGGSDPFIVLDDADIEKAVYWAVIGRMNNTGQCCVAAKRFIVMESVYTEFLTKLKAAFQSLKVGNPMDDDTQLGPLSSQDALSDLSDQINKSVKAGAKVELGGGRIDRLGAYMEPTILSDINKNNPAYFQELFGPVALLFRAKTIEEAINLANDTSYGLGASIFTSNIKQGKLLADQIDAGMIFINHPAWTQPDLPFGGTKRSGYGRELSESGLEEFINKKLIRTSLLTDPF
ncbi:Succinate-semialdehyde dehydrogenase [NADP(+)] [Proteiniphilum saccharofermentans]|uniref:Succinate-semialdehyde dehydrogenase [NADP(+)] n=2 Tax=Dysgonomonadaceae TaxID=2005520 RepID=A0A1R3TDE6_9BACT|nr:Succinate-semialdehyde dehydrogenase [NADP(+)] [Proteiniphilum saccharofermentans]